MNLILTSDFPSSLNADLVARLPAWGRGARVAWIAPAPSSRLIHFPRARWRFRSIGIRNLEFVDAGAPGPEQGELTNFDAIYLSGGDPIRFRRRLADSGLGDQIREFAGTGRPVIAASGGAMQLTGNVSLYRLLSVPLARVVSERDSFQALGLAEFEILPHLNRHDHRFLDLVSRYSAAVDPDVIALEDGAAILCSGTAVPQCIGRAVCYRRGAATVQ